MLLCRSRRVLLGAYIFAWAGYTMVRELPAGRGDRVRAPLPAAVGPVLSLAVLSMLLAALFLVRSREVPVLTLGLSVVFVAGRALSGCLDGVFTVDSCS